MSVLLDYWSWHYGRALIHLIRLLKTAWWFFVAYFSIPLLCRTLLAPYKRMTESGTLAERLVLNTLSRLVGATLRLVVCLLGLCTLLGTVIGGVVLYALWLSLPLLLLLGFFFGGSLVISSLLVV